MKIENQIFQKIGLSADFVFKSNNYTTSVIFEFAVGRDLKQMNVFERHKKILEGMKLVDNFTKLITTSCLKFEYPKEFCSG